MVGKFCRPSLALTLDLGCCALTLDLEVGCSSISWSDWPDDHQAENIARRVARHSWQSRYSCHAMPKTNGAAVDAENTHRANERFCELKCAPHEESRVKVGSWGAGPACAAWVNEEESRETPKSSLTTACDQGPSQVLGAVSMLQAVRAQCVPE